MLTGLQNSLALAQFLCNMGHERSMGLATPIAPVFDWMERFITIAASKGFPPMPVHYTDAMMWGMLTQEDRAAFSYDGFTAVIHGIDTTIQHISILNAFGPDPSYESAFVNNPDPDFMYRIAKKVLGTNRWQLKYPARGIAIQWMMEAVRVKLEGIEEGIETESSKPSIWSLSRAYIELLREAYSLVEACYAEWVEFIRNSGQLGTFYSPELAGIVEAPQERRPPPLLEY